MKKIVHLLKNDPVLVISGILAFVSMFLVLPDKEYIDYLDFHVLALLFSLMCVMNGYQEIGFFRRLAEIVLKKTGSTRQLTAVLVFLCFFFSMFITNDVSLITFVPFTVLILNMVGQQKLMIHTIVLQTIAANLGSMLTPIGNPQNLYLYNLSGMGFGEFVLTLLPYSAISLLLLILCLFLKKNEKVSLETLDFESSESFSGSVSYRKSLLLYTALFLICLLCVLRLIPWPLMLILVLTSLFFCNRRLLLKADFGLLTTFVFFFLFIGNMGRIPSIVSTLGSILKGYELPVSVLSSQVISNVPAAMLLSGFTANYTPLLIGVNLGGLGTLIASLASLISYKQYAALPGSNKGQYLLIFTVFNLVFLAILMITAYIFH